MWTHPQANRGAIKTQRSPWQVFLGRNPKKPVCFLEELCAKTQEEYGRGKYEDSLQDIRRGSAGIDAEFGEHDGDDMVPVVEEEPI